MQDTGVQNSNTGNKKKEISLKDIDTIKESPFIYREGMIATKIKSRDTSAFLLTQMLINGTFTKLHSDILNILYDFTYLNAYLLRQRLSHLNKEPPINAISFRKILKDMLKKGLIVQYEIKTPTGNDEYKGSPFIYAVSLGGLHYLKKQKGWKYRNTVSAVPFSVERALCILAENQFFIMLEEQYGDTDILNHVDFCGNSYHYAGVRGMYGIRLQDNSIMSLFVFAVRRTKDWYKDFTSLLQQVQEYHRRTSQGELCSILVICETEAQSMECERVRCSVEQIKQLEVFYTTDSSPLMENDVFDRLIQVDPKDNYSKRTIFRLNLRQETEGKGEGN